MRLPLGVRAFALKAFGYIVVAVTIDGEERLCTVLYSHPDRRPFVNLNLREGKKTMFLNSKSEYAYRWI